MVGLILPDKIKIIHAIQGCPEANKINTENNNISNIILLYIEKDRKYFSCLFTK